MQRELSTWLPCNLHSLLGLTRFIVCVYSRGKKKRKWVHKVETGLFVLLPVAIYSSDTALTVLEINQEEREDSEGLDGNKIPKDNRDVWRPRSRQSLLVFPSRVGQHPLVGSLPWLALRKHPLKTCRVRMRMCSPCTH